MPSIGDICILDTSDDKLLGNFWLLMWKRERKRTQLVFTYVNEKPLFREVCSSGLLIIMTPQLGFPEI